MTANQPLISILMRYYKLGDYLKEAIKSLQAQTYTNWELLVVDDASPECFARDVLAGENDARIRICRIDESRGAAAARNTAAENSTGAVFVILDSNDLLAPQYIERTFHAMKESAAAAAYCDVQIFGTESYVYKPKADLGVIFSGHYPHNTLMVTREAFNAVGGYRQYGNIEGLHFWVSLLEHGIKFAHVPEPLYLYRKHEESNNQKTNKTLSSNFRTLLLDHKDSVAQHLPSLLNKKIEDLDAEIKEAEMRAKYTQLHHEFHALLARYEALEKQASASETMLSSISWLSGRFTQLCLKRLGMQK